MDVCFEVPVEVFSLGSELEATCSISIYIYIYKHLVVAVALLLLRRNVPIPSKGSVMLQDVPTVN